MSAMLIKNALVVALDDAGTILPNGQILVEGSKIAAVGAAVKAPAGAQVVDAEGRVAIPGLINAHHHFYSSFARGFAPPGEPAANFVEILQRMWWKLDLALDPEAGVPVKSNLTPMASSEPSTRVPLAIDLLLSVTGCA